MSSVKLAAALVLALIAVLTVGTAESQTTFTVTATGTTDYRINNVNDPTLELTRGETYTFNISAAGHPFWIKTVASPGTGNAFTNGVTGNGTEVGTLTFVVPMNAPATLHYNCEFHSPMTGTINIVNPVAVRPDSWGKLKHRYL
ncbi:MAG TPA: hypothetical protein VFP10_14060 [Candidatus Eisenbacteria bacterium]|nr:hypothetical protein [Candidatus Eisenbacteria bacterium]